MDFNYIIKQVNLQETPLGEILQSFEHRWGQKPTPEIRIEIIDVNNCLLYLNNYRISQKSLDKLKILRGFQKTIIYFRNVLGSLFSRIVKL